MRAGVQEDPKARKAELKGGDSAVSSSEAGRREPGEWGRRAFLAFRLTLTALLLLWAVEAHAAGALASTLNQFMLLTVVVAIPVRIYWAVRRRLVLPPELFRAGGRGYMLQALNRSLFWVLLAYATVLTLPMALLNPPEREALPIFEGAAAGILVLAEWLPNRRIYRLPNALLALGSLYLLIQLGGIFSPPPAGAVQIAAPFQGSWNVFHGGRSTMVNHHYAIQAQQYALDLDRSLQGPPRQEPGKLESYPAWDQPLYAPADGRVVRVVNNLPDNPIGKTDTRSPAGNQIVIDIGSGRFAMLAHLKEGSATVEEGDQVRQGQLLGRCGNSGNTSQPHIHFQIQSSPEFTDPHLRTFPILFNNVEAIRRGERLGAGPVDPRRNDILTTGGPPS